MHEPNDDPWLPKLFQEVVLPYVLKFVVCHADAVEARVTVAIAASTIFFIFKSPRFQLVCLSF